MTLTEILNIVVILLPIFGGYAVYAIQKKAKIIDEIVIRLYGIEKAQAIIEHAVNNIKRS